MKYEDALAEFENELIKEYGISEPIVKIALHPKVFEHVLMGYSERFTFRCSDFAEPHIMGIGLFSRERDKF